MALEDKISDQASRRKGLTERDVNEAKKIYNSQDTIEKTNGCIMEALQGTKNRN